MKTIKSIVPTGSICNHPSSSHWAMLVATIKRAKAASNIIVLFMCCLSILSFGIPEAILLAAAT